ncbi:MAG: hypothetical protein U9M92_01605 [Patescibacteria group bacterium]|nr:hypothetical protein [Patescibacteria group bacterium]
MADDKTTAPTEDKPQDKPESTQEDKRQEAQRAMEGAEWTTKREAETKSRELKNKLSEVGKRLAEIAAEKEKLELAWIDLDNARRQIRTIVDPILAEEKKTEAEEAALEAEEQKIGVASEKQVVEKKRWDVQDKRKEVEKRKWGEEEKLSKIEVTVNENTTLYRQLLDEEDKLHRLEDQLKAEGGV